LKVFDQTDSLLTGLNIIVDLDTLIEIFPWGTKLFYFSLFFTQVVDFLADFCQFLLKPFFLVLFCLSDLG
jgi:hypothetical protein